MLTAPPPYDHVSCEFILTARCNLRCSYCIATSLPSASMSVEVGMRALEMFMDLAEGATTCEIAFTGGEPLLCFRTLRALTGGAQKRAYQHGITPHFVLKTNGTLITPEIIAFLREGPWKVVVSADGMAEVHDRFRRDISGKPTYAAVLNGISSLLSAGVPCVGSLTVHPHAYESVAKNVEHLHALGVTNIDVGPAYGTVQWNNIDAACFAKLMEKIAAIMRNRNENGQFLEVGPIYRESEHIEEQLRDTWGCHAAASNLAFLPNGTIAGCSALAMLAPQFPNLILGDVRQGIDDHLLSDFLRMSQAGLCDRKKCQHCKAGPNCSGGCIAINYATTGLPLDPPQFYCGLISAIPDAWRLAWGDARTTALLQKS